MVDFASMDLPDAPPPSEPGTDPLAQHLLLHDDGRVWDLGPALVDTDSDGIPDTVTRVGTYGMVIFTDSDHDGEVDQITSVTADGDYESTARDSAGGQWRATDSGRLD